jgi:hypothetical protein
MLQQKASVSDPDPKWIWIHLGCANRIEEGKMTYKKEEEMFTRTNEDGCLLILHKGLRINITISI